MSDKIKQEIKQWEEKTKYLIGSDKHVLTNSNVSWCADSILNDELNHVIAYKYNEGDLDYWTVVTMTDSALNKRKRSFVEYRILESWRK